MKVRIGDKIRIICMDGEPQYDGKTGYVDLIDDAGQIHGTWGGCALIPGVDQYENLSNQDVKLLGMGLAAYGALYIVLTIMEQFFGVSI